MREGNFNLQNVIKERNNMLQKEKELYINAVQKLNMSTRELLKNDFGTILVKNCAKDVSGEVVRRYFNTSDYYITVDQMFDRIVNFSYENDNDIFEIDESIRKAFYNINDSEKMSSRLYEISAEAQGAQRQLFNDNRSKDKLDREGKISYRKAQTTEDGKLYDEITGREGTSKVIVKNGKDISVSELHADHIQARESVMYNEKYIRQEKRQKLKEFYNSKDNMQMMHESANSSKKDVRVCKVDGKIEYLQSNEMNSRISKGEVIEDITYRATAKELADATIAQWEKETKSGKKIENLKEQGYLDENGKVKEEVRKKLEENIRYSQNTESIEILKSIDYYEVAKDTTAKTANSIGKIIGGQVVYYVLPPLVFETQKIIKRKNMTLDKFWGELKKASKRIVNYVISKLDNVFKNIFKNSINNFVKIFFDIIIEMVKATVKKLVKIIKDVVISLVNCIKIIMDKKSTVIQKADAVTKTISVTINGVVMELLFEYLEKQFGIPDIIMEPLQIIVTVISTNIIMLILQKVDLFDVQYGLLVANIERVFDEVNEQYLNESKILFDSTIEKSKEYINMVNEHIREIKDSITNLNIYEEEVSPYLMKISEVFNMELDFNYEWNEFIKII